MSAEEGRALGSAKSGLVPRRPRNARRAATGGIEAGVVQSKEQSLMAGPGGPRIGQSDLDTMLAAMAA